MVALEEIAIIVSVIAVIIPIIVLGMSRYFAGSDRLSRNSTFATFSIDDIRKELNSIKENIDEITQDNKIELKEIQRRLEQLSASLQLLCYRVDKLEKVNN